MTKESVHPCLREGKVLMEFEKMGVCVKKRPEIALKMLYVSKRDLKQA